MRAVHAVQGLQVTQLPGDGGAGCGWIELARPEKRNCLSQTMLTGLRAVLDHPAADRLLLTGAGAGFCSGLDLQEVAGPDAGLKSLHLLVAVYRNWLRLRIPTAVLAGGFAVGGGAGLLLCAGTVLVAEPFRFRVPKGELARLAAVVVPLCELRAGGKTPPGGWLGCDLNATEAQALGLVDQVVPASVLAEFRRTQRVESGWFRAGERSQASVSAALEKMEFVLESYLGRADE